MVVMIYVIFIPFGFKLCNLQEADEF